MSKTTEVKTIPTPEFEDRIRELAYQMWEEEGRPEGRAEAHWEQACLVIMDADAGPAVESPEWLARRALKATRPHPAQPTPQQEQMQEHMEELKRRTISRSAA
jgi:hypothetical protein